MSRPTDSTRTHKLKIVHQRTRAHDRTPTHTVVVRVGCVRQTNSQPRVGFTLETRPSNSPPSECHCRASRTAAVAGRRIGLLGPDDTVAKAGIANNATLRTGRIKHRKPNAETRVAEGTHLREFRSLRLEQCQRNLEQSCHTRTSTRPAPPCTESAQVTIVQLVQSHRRMQRTTQVQANPRPAQLLNK